MRKPALQTPPRTSAPQLNFLQLQSQQHPFALPSLATLTKVDVVLWSCLVSALVLLSVAPHQEPRFLIPLLLPLVLLAGSPFILYNPYSTVHCQKVTAEHQANRRLLSTLKFSASLAFVIFNIALVIFWAFIHQVRTRSSPCERERERVCVCVCVCVSLVEQNDSLPLITILGRRHTIAHKYESILGVYRSSASTDVDTAYQRH
jgi:hypothetical protein